MAESSKLVIVIWCSKAVIVYPQSSEKYDKSDMPKKYTWVKLNFEGKILRIWESYYSIFCFLFIAAFWKIKEMFLIIFPLSFDRKIVPFLDKIIK